MFVKTSDGNWNNLTRASQILIERGKQRGDWVVIARYSGAAPIIQGGFSTAQAAHDWCGDMLERHGLTASDWEWDD